MKEAQLVIAQIKCQRCKQVVDIRMFTQQGIDKIPGYNSLNLKRL